MGCSCYCGWGWSWLQQAQWTLNSDCWNKHAVTWCVNIYYMYKPRGLARLIVVAKCDGHFSTWTLIAPPVGKKKSLYCSFCCEVWQVIHHQEIVAQAMCFTMIILVAHRVIITGQKIQNLWQANNNLDNNLDFHGTGN